MQFKTTVNRVAFLQCKTVLSSVFTGVTDFEPERCEWGTEFWPGIKLESMRLM